MADQRNEWAKREMQRLRAERGNKCDICDEPLGVLCDGHPNLQFAHLRPTGLKGAGRGRQERVLDIRKHRADYRLLCIDCHREHDALRREMARLEPEALIELRQEIAELTEAL